MAAPDTPLYAQTESASPGTSIGWTNAASVVCATGIIPGETSILIRAHWPSPPAGGASGVKVYARPRLDAGGWSGVGIAAIPAGADGLAIEIPRSILTDGRSVLMHLSAEEVSELVYLAYLIDGDAAGYEASVVRCPKILKPVVEIKTTFGKRLRQALTEGGMLAQCGSAAVR